MPHNVSFKPIEFDGFNVLFKSLIFVREIYNDFDNPSRINFLSGLFFFTHFAVSPPVNSVGSLKCAVIIKIKQDYICLYYVAENA